jgi:nucleotide-binding universal stress UspA family protein
MRSNRERAIVVGVDGSDSSKTALAWAVHQGELEHAPVQAVIACRPRSRYTRQRVAGLMP